LNSAMFFFLVSPQSSVKIFLVSLNDASLSVFSQDPPSLEINSFSVFLLPPDALTFRPRLSQLSRGIITQKNVYEGSQIMALHKIN
jgi:hypothetical protein